MAPQGHTATSDTVDHFCISSSMDELFGGLELGEQLSRLVKENSGGVSIFGAQRMQTEPTGDMYSVHDGDEPLGAA
ncbi:cb5eb1d0-2055-4334-9847-b7b04a7a3e24 [Sclerotinia trifoliorum]|uniref:Cb5eb1d0-2055-4334-9847-b7b04a7a3e24 n=1 Tax=Sclerotinia trifoliorum TaxID=28548 RepID=A0A8H2VLQ1_9HELO|nr:cb5eb1d0-2055-4334-9847-b7b04a7a3e24 [Sclerotinia trifoliorum]